MQTRRQFIKGLMALGAFALPWTLLPGKVRRGIYTTIRRPPVDVVLPSEQVSIPGDMPEGLNLTAWDDIITLTGQEMGGRRSGSAGEAKAAQYLARQLSMLGLRPLGDAGNFSQAFTIPPVREKIVNGRLMFQPGDAGNLRVPSANILGELVGQRPDEIILLSAHYDHLGTYGGHLYPGANDNASGVGCVLDVIRRIIRRGSSPTRSILIAFWGAEEMGFVGSRYFTQHPLVPLKNIQAVINVDTVGNGSIGDFALWADGENTAVKAIQKAASESGASALITSNGGHNSDQVSFAAAGIPAVTIMARDWLYKNHTPEDSPGLLKKDQIYLATEIVYQAIYNLAFD